MRKKALVVIGIMIFILGQVGVNYLIYKNKFSTPIPKVKLKDQEEKKDTFAIMLEQSDGTYQATESTSFNQPGYTFNNEKSGCIDTNGNKIENALSYNETTKVIGVTSNKTIYCYVYFDKAPLNGENLVTEKGLWQSGLEGDGYRYTGTNPDNYICFGTTNKDTCLGNTGTYMYRIIGVFPDSAGNQHMKLIKKEPLADDEGNFELMWNNSDTKDIAWENSTLYSAINGNTYLTNVTYMPAEGSKKWSNRITNWTWSAVNTLSYESSGPDYYDSVSPKNIYLHELNRNGKTNNKGEWTTPQRQIGLMYVSDYVLSLGIEALNLTTGTNSNRSKLKTGWMHLSNNNTTTSSTLEWTISRDGSSGGNNYHVWGIFLYGYVYDYYPTNTGSVRPVFYLNSDQVIQSGSGKIDNPFILS